MHGQIPVNHPTRRRRRHSRRPHLMKAATQPLFDSLAEIRVKVLELAYAEFSEIPVPVLVCLENAFDVCP